MLQLVTGTATSLQASFDIGFRHGRRSDKESMKQGEARQPVNPAGPNPNGSQFGRGEKVLRGGQAVHMLGILFSPPVRSQYAK